MESSNNSPILNICLGTYSGKIVKFDLLLLKKKTTNTELIQCSSFKASESMVRCIFPYKDFIFTGGSDETIRIYNIRKMKEIGSVMSYSGAINQIKIFNDKFLFALCDKTIEVWKMKNFTHHASLNSHKSQVNSFLIHKSGKLIVSAAKDNYLMIWNLVTSKCKFRYKFTDEIIDLNWLHDQDLLMCVFTHKIIVLDYLKDSDSFSEWNLVTIEIGDTKDYVGRIIKAIVFKTYMIIFKSNNAIKILKFNTRLDKKMEDFSSNVLKHYTSQDIFLENPILDRTKELSKHDIEQYSNIRIKYVELIKEKYNLIIVVFSTGNIFVFDLFKIVKNFGLELKRIKKFKEFKPIKDRITSLGVLYFDN